MRAPPRKLTPTQGSVGNRLAFGHRKRDCPELGYQIFSSDWCSPGNGPTHGYRAPRMSNETDSEDVFGHVRPGGRIGRSGRPYDVRIALRVFCNTVRGDDEFRMSDHPSSPRCGLTDS